MMKRIISIFLVAMLVLIGFPMNALAEQPKVFKPAGKSAADFVPDEVIVKFKDDSKPFKVIKVPTGKVKEKIKEYSTRSDVVYAEPNYYYYAFSDDAFYKYQWNLRDQDEGGVRAEEAWGTSTGSGVIVAIIDTGIAYENYSKYYQAPDLAETNFVQGYDFVNNDLHPNDDNSHGTHVAGTVAQSTNNQIGTAGVAYNASLMPIKVLNKRGRGSNADIADGIYFAANNHAKVINLSLGGSSPSETLEAALQYAYNQGVTIVAASGNEGRNGISYPAAYDDYVIAVGATRYDKTRAPYSNYGTSLDIVAPGGDTSVDQNDDGYVDGILQNTFNPTSKNTSDFGYWFFQGTSMASPHVAGVAALVIANGNATTPDQVRAALETTALDLDNSLLYGAGLVDAVNALGWSDTPNNPPVANSDSVFMDEDTSKEITLEAEDSDGDTLSFTILDGPYNGIITGRLPDVVYTPNENYYGSDSFTFQANDGRADSNIATIEIAINAVNDAPVANNQEVTTEVDIPIDIALDVSDPEDDSLTYLRTVDTSNGSISWPPESNSVTYTPNPGFIGNDSFSYSATDSEGLSDTATVNINVVEPVENPVADLDIVMSTDSRQAGRNNFVWAYATVSTGVADALVTGHWEGATTNSVSGYTTADGVVIFESNQVKTSTTGLIFTFVVDGLEKDGQIYDLTGETRDEIIW